MSGKARKYSAALVTIRQLAVLGLPGEMVRDTLAEVIRRLLPCDLVLLMRIDGRGMLADAWINFPELLPQLGLYLEHFYNAREAEAHVTFGEFFRSTTAVDLLHSNPSHYLNSALYNEIYHLLDFRYIIRAALRDGPVARGCITLTRSHLAKDFSAQEMRLMEVVAPYLTHALHTPAVSGEVSNDTEVAEGTLICDAQGAVEYVTAQGRILLHEAAAVPLTAATLSDRCCSWASPLLVRMIEETRRLESGREGAVPVAVRSNRHGRYVLRAWRLGATVGSDARDPYTVAIRRYIPLALRLLRCPEVLMLPAREREVCLLLAQGLEIKEIARCCGITTHTAITYVRQIYQRLGINRRQDLVSRLVEPGCFLGTRSGQAVTPIG